MAFWKNESQSQGLGSKQPGTAGRGKAKSHPHLLISGQLPTQASFGILCLCRALIFFLTSATEALFIVFKQCSWRRTGAYGAPRAVGLQTSVVDLGDSLGTVKTSASLIIFFFFFFACERANASLKGTDSYKSSIASGYTTL